MQDAKSNDHWVNYQKAHLMHASRAFDVDMDMNVGAGAGAGAGVGVDRSTLIYIL